MKEFINKLMSMRVSENELKKLPPFYFTIDRMADKPNKNKNIIFGSEFFQSKMIPPKKFYKKISRFY